MKSKWRALATLCALILILHILMVSSLHLPYEKKINRGERSQVSRKLLSSGSSISENEDKLNTGGGTSETKKTVGASKNAIPPSGSNPAQN